MNGKRPLTCNEQTLLLAYLKNTDRQRDYLFVLAGLRTGCRARKLLSIRVKHFVVGGAVGREGREILLPRSAMKFGRGKLARKVAGRRMPIHPELWVALEDYWINRMPQRLDAESCVFESSSRRLPISVVQAWRCFTQACQTVGIFERVALHSLRKSVPNEGHGITRDLVKTQAILGHQSPLTTIKYLETSLDELDAIVCGLGESASAAIRRAP